ncbi:reverse transcriptase (RNA-dependent DNA polymerase) domain-containing protein [Hirsutella rhossiliensis]|uniref:Reverse transcriptase (RNA-dependent DNA polymerase) domain-containing protein n=1 Tax=Hirsutella rhossiliensis TaxID=111463 RepID=A0A9P8SC50_9HYPO|nr:reverse transcriptase (RNA-dependent DNA polymerase) domain-containing protein [Hirsutella rhossiliensis]KAH0957181.1 reverse transcriptase (RNA-dependent DNA polymerase) domain-containing protein [Hirsutella rhossiliensis]
MVRRLTKEEKSLVRQMGVQLSAQQKRQTPKARVSDQSDQSPGRPQILSLESTAPRAAGGDGSSDMGAIYEPAAPSTPCIVVATTPPHSCDATLMPRCFPRNRSDRRILRIFQANVGKIPPAHDCALALADSEQYDIILLQEPWTGLKDGRCLTKTHQAYDTFSPVNDWDGRDTRPRVMTYVRRSAGLVADQKRPAATRDILWLTVNGITVVNFYRQPYHDGALEILLQWTVPDKCLVAGDFNAKHPSWQAGRREDRGEEIAFWAMDNRLGLLNPVDVPTNAHGNTVDLAFCNIPLADAVVEDHLATGSDHFTLSITLPGQVLAPLPIGKIHLNSDEELKRFIELVEAGAAFIPITTASPSELDSFASALVRFKLLLQIDDRVYETQLEKATALRQATLERRTANDDIPDPWISVNTDRTIPFTDRVSPEETRDATLRTGNTSPGPDNITVRMLRAVWHAIGSLVHQLYQGCLRIGHHPKPFREAEVVMIAKPGRRDLSTPRAWRPISFSWASVHFGVLHPQQAGALPKRSAVDLVAALIHDIEEAFACKQVATLVTLDIQGAFDTVLRNRLILRLREQGWPPNLARWVGSFMQDRSARIRYQDIATNSSPLQCGLPQGSPVSPILFLLYTEPIYRLGSSKGRFGYADDTAILCVGDSLDETSAEASHHVRELVSWGAANGISFDPEKTEVMHFSRTTPKTAPPVLHGEFEKRPGRAMRWLGVWLDSTLSFKTHVEKWTAKAQAVAFHLRRLTNTRHGPLPSAVRRAVCACVIPVLLYAAEVWYPGSTRPRWTKPGKEGPSRIGHLVKKMSKALYTSLRAILPVWRTTPTNVLHREAGIPPVPLLLEARRTAFAARLKSLDEAHPLRRSDELLPSCPRPALLQRGFVEEQTAPLQSASKNETAKKFRDWLQALSPRTLVVYSDGSRSTEGHAGYGYVVHRDGSTVLRDKGRLGPAEIFDAEAKGALEGLKAAVSLPETDRIFVCLDNLATATCLRGTPSDSSQEVFLEFQSLAGASLPEPADNVPTLAHLRKIARQQPEEAFKAWWEASAPERYRDLRLKATTSCPSELALSRPLLRNCLQQEPTMGILLTTTKGLVTTMRD